MPDLKISDLPASPALVGTEPVPIDVGSTTYRTTTGAIAALANVSLSDGGLSMKGYITPGAGIDQTAGINSCIDDAIANGYAFVKPIFSLFPMEISDLIAFKEMEYRGFGDEQAGSGFLGTAAAAEVRFADIDAAYQGSWSQGFKIDGGGFSTHTMTVGVKIIGKFFNITLVGADDGLADFEDGAALWLLGTQNTVFENIQAAQGMVACRVDGGADTNTFLNCHWNAASDLMVDFCSLTTIPGLFDVSGYNIFDGNIFEHNVDSMRRLVWHRSGSWNQIRSSVLSVTNAGTSAVDYAVYASQEYASVVVHPSFLEIEGCTFTCTPSSTTKVAIFAEVTAQIDLGPKNKFFSWNYCLQGNVVISGEQTFFTSHTQDIDFTTQFPFVPTGRKGWGDVITVPTSASQVEAIFVHGETFARFAKSPASWAFGDGTANPATTIFLESIGVMRTNGVWKVDGDLYARRNTSAQVLMTSATGAPAIVGGTALTSYVYWDTTNKVLQQAPGNSFRTGTAATGSRPSASAVAKGAQFYDSTLNIPIWSNGTAWTNALGTLV